MFLNIKSTCYSYRSAIGLMKTMTRFHKKLTTVSVPIVTVLERPKWFTMVHIPCLITCQDVYLKFMNNGRSKINYYRTGLSPVYNRMHHVRLRSRAQVQRSSLWLLSCDISSTRRLVHITLCDKFYTYGFFHICVVCK